MQMRQSIFTSFLWIVFITFSCNEQGSNQRNNKAFQEELKSRELKRATEAEISNAAYEQGARIADIAQDLLNESLQSDDSVMNLLVHYKEALLAINDSVAQKESVEIKRVANHHEAPNSMEGIILDAYLYNIEQSLRVEDNIQEIDKEYFLYTRPIILNDDTCLRCHGEVGADLLEADAKHIEQKHPELPTGYKKGEFMGMWSIKMSRKEVIRAL